MGHRPSRCSRAASGSHAREAALSGQTPAHPKFDQREILVVEDEELIATVIEEMLLDLGCRRVRIAASVKEALMLLDQKLPDAVVLDVHLGGDSGFHLAQTLADRKIPFVFATGLGRHGLPDEWTSRPIIQKPFKLEALAAVLATLLP
ncbi:MAG TPA: response regulator [Stellaceae bacterium]|nr:response regulator [Stellaceae bacterium]